MQTLTTEYLEHDSKRVTVRKSTVIGYEVLLDGRRMGRVVKDSYPQSKDAARAPWRYYYAEGWQDIAGIECITKLCTGYGRFETRKDAVDELLFVQRHKYEANAAA